MDVLSEVLKAVRLDGALFYNAEFSAPWSFQSPPSSAVAPYFGEGMRHVIIYHLVTEGRAYASVENSPAVSLGAGDLVIFPHGDPHVVRNGPPCTPADYGRELKRIVSQGLKIARTGGGGEITRFVCGYMACDPNVSKVLLSGLPPLIRVAIGNDDSGKWLENSIRFAVDKAAESGAGAEAVRARLSELLFVEALRRFISVLSPGTTGWLAGVRDPEIGTAIALLHRDPSRPWTVDDLAKAAGVSRSVLAERFQHYIGETPIAYLTRWRLQLAAQRLATSSQGVATLAAGVGYRSEAAFNRAFKREFGLPPARFRSRSKETAIAAGSA
jgi:AraC-like DNA-binding protein